MEEKKKYKLQHFIIICQKKKRDTFLKLLAEYSAHATGTLYGKGSASTGALALALGLEIEVSRAVISCLLPTEKAEILIQRLIDEFGFDKANTGIAFSIPVDGLAF